MVSPLSLYQFDDRPAARCDKTARFVDFGHRTAWVSRLGPARRHRRGPRDHPLLSAQRL